MKKFILIFYTLIISMTICCAERVIKLDPEEKIPAVIIEKISNNIEQKVIVVDSRDYSWFSETKTLREYYLDTDNVIRSRISGKSTDFNDALIIGTIVSIGSWFLLIVLRNSCFMGIEVVSLFIVFIATMIWMYKTHWSNFFMVSVFIILVTIIIMKAKNKFFETMLQKK